MIPMLSNRRTFIKTSLSLGLPIAAVPFLHPSKIGSRPRKKPELIYSNPLSDRSDFEDFTVEGEAVIDFENQRLRMKNALPVSEGRRAHFVAWCKHDFPSNLQVEWDFYPVQEPGLCMLFFAAKGVNGEDLFDDSLNERTGVYPQYHSGDINTYHLSYFRRKHPEERAFQTCNLRKSKGFELVARGADPIPSVKDAQSPYSMSLTKMGSEITFSINNLMVLKWTDEQVPLEDGKIGFRQMAPLIAEYQNLKVYEL